LTTFGGHLASRQGTYFAQMSILAEILVFSRLFVTKNTLKAVLWTYLGHRNREKPIWSPNYVVTADEKKKIQAILC